MKKDMIKIGKKKSWKKTLALLVVGLFIGSSMTIINLGTAEIIHNHGDKWTYSDNDFSEWLVSTSADGNYIAAANADGELKIFESAQTGDPVPLREYDMNDEICSISISSDGRYIAAGNIKGKVHLYDRTKLVFPKIMSYNTGEKVFSVSISDDGRYIAVGNARNKVYLLDRDKIGGDLRWSHDTLSDVHTVSISADGEYIAAGNANGIINLYHKDSGGTPLWDIGCDTETYVCSVSISENGDYISAGNAAGEVYVFQKESNIPLWKYTADTYVSSVSISRNGEYIAVGSMDNNVYLFHRGYGMPLWNYTTDNRGVRSVSISEDGSFIAAGCKGVSVSNRFLLFYKDSNNPIWNDVIYGSSIPCVSISSNGEDVAVGSLNHVYYFHDAYELEEDQLVDENDDRNVIPIVYAILHDPNGDDSFSRLNEWTSNTLGISAYLNVGRYVHWEADNTMFGVGAGYATDVGVTHSLSADVSISYTKSESVTSSDLSEKDYIGPGRGDVYWLELWDLGYKLIQRNLSINNRDFVFEIPIFRYGFIRHSSCAVYEEWIINNESISDDWKERILGLNIGRDNYISPLERLFVKPVDPLEFQSGIGKTYGLDITTYKSISIGYDVSISHEAATHFGFDIKGLDSQGNALIGSSMNYGASVAASNTQGKAIDLYLHDTNHYGAPDNIAMDVYQDRIFGTYITICHEDESYTSGPHEYLTQRTDTLPPDVSFHMLPNESFVSGNWPVTLKGENDNDPNLHFIIYIDRVEVWNQWESQVSTEMPWNTYLYSEGIHTLKGTVTDTSGNTDETNIWVIVDNNQGNDPPGNPYNPSPATESVNVGVRPPLAWSCDDPDLDPITYDAYLDQNNPPLAKVASNISSASYTPMEDLDEFSTYYWKIVAWDDTGKKNLESEIWEFITTVPNQPPMISGEDPEDNFTYVPIDTDELSVLIEDPDNDWFDWSIETSPYIGGFASSGNNGIKTCPASGLEISTNYTWYVNVTDIGSEETSRKV